MEVIGTVGAIKYLFKYITKGQDMVGDSEKFGNVPKKSMHFSQQVMVDKSEREDEISQHINASWFGDTNSLWRLFEFNMTEMTPSVQRLAIHMPDQQDIRYDPSKVQTKEDLLQVMNSQKRTTLTEFFEGKPD